MTTATEIPDRIHLQKCLQAKLHPHRFTEMSPKMAAMVATVLGVSWTTPDLPFGLSITSDGHVIGHTRSVSGTYLGTAYDWEGNVRLLLDVAGVTDDERAEWHRLYAEAVTDWRQE